MRFFYALFSILCACADFVLLREVFYYYTSNPGMVLAFMINETKFDQAEILNREKQRKKRLNGPAVNIHRMP